MRALWWKQFVGVWTIVLALTAVPGALVAQESADTVAEGSGVDAGGDDIATSSLADAMEEAASSWMEDKLGDTLPWLFAEVLGTPIWRYVMAVLMLTLILALRRWLMNRIVKTIHRLTEATENKFDDLVVDALDPPLGHFIAVLAVYLAVIWIQVGEGPMNVIDSVFRISLILILASALLRLTDLVGELLASAAGKTDTNLDDHLLPLVRSILKLAVFVLTVIFVVGELGYSVAGLLAGLGIGALAFPLAAKDMLSNWFGALMIYTDHPFTIGDWIKTDSLEGVVEEIGLRSTKVRTFSKTVVSVPNAGLANDTVENFSRMNKRRVYFKVGVTYATTPAMMKETLARMKDVLRSHPGVDQSFWIVRFSEFADSALSIMVYFFTQTTVWDEYLQIREEVNLAFMEKLHDIGVEFAFPSQSIYMEKSDDEELRKLDARARDLYSKRVKIHDEGHEDVTAPADGDADG